jgi:hypothetical protein
MPTSSVPVSVVAGSDGTVVRAGAVKLSAPVKSPVAPRRQADRLGTGTPNRVSMRRSVDVWSSVPEYLAAEMASVG